MAFKGGSRGKPKATPNAPVEEQKRSRVVFLGSGRVGKTSLIRRFLEGTFEPKYHPTVEDIYSRMFHVRDHIVDLDIMDTSGSYDFPAMRRICISRASALVLVFGQNDIYSFEHVKELMKQISEEREDHKTMPIVVVCNKMDIPLPDRQVPDKAIDSWTDEIHLSDKRIIYTSAQTGQGVLGVFHCLWDQNQITRKITFETLPSAETNNANGTGYDNTKRRLSAFAVLSNPEGENSSPSPPPPPPPAPELEDAGSKLPRRLFRNKFGSSMRRASTKRSNKNSSKGPQSDAPTKLDCVVS